MNYIAKFRTFSSTELDVPIIADGPAEAIREATNAGNALRHGTLDVRLVSISDKAGKTVLRPTTSSELAPGWSEVVWRMRFKTEDHEEAACLARISQADPVSLGSVFEVHSADGRVSNIDLQSVGSLPH